MGAAAAATALDLLMRSGTPGTAAASGTDAATGAAVAAAAAAAASAVVGAIVGAALGRVLAGTTFPMFALGGGVPCAFCLAMAMPDLAIAAPRVSSRDAGSPTALDAFHSNVKN